VLFTVYAPLIVSATLVSLRPDRLYGVDCLRGANYLYGINFLRGAKHLCGINFLRTAKHLYGINFLRTAKHLCGINFLRTADCPLFDCLRAANCPAILIAYLKIFLSLFVHCKSWPEWCQYAKRRSQTRNACLLQFRHQHFISGHH